MKIVMLTFNRMESSDAEGRSWYDKYLTAAKNRGFLHIVETIHDGNLTTLTTRAQTAQLIVNTM